MKYSPVGDHHKKAMIRKASPETSVFLSPLGEEVCTCRSSQKGSLSRRLRSTELAASLDTYMLRGKTTNPRQVQDNTSIMADHKPRAKSNLHLPKLWLKIQPGVCTSCPIKKNWPVAQSILISLTAHPPAHLPFTKAYY